MAGDEPNLWRRRALIRVTWETAAELMSALATAVARSGFDPDTLVAIARGGLPAGVVLSHRLRVPRFSVMTIERNLSDVRYSTRAEPALRCLAPDEGLEGRAVLVVDDIMGDGGTLALARRVLAERGAGEIRTAVVALNANCPARPDFHAVVVDDWTVFPWESPIREDEAATLLRPRTA